MKANELAPVHVGKKLTFSAVFNGPVYNAGRPLELRLSIEGTDGGYLMIPAELASKLEVIVEDAPTSTVPNQEANRT